MRAITIGQRTTLHDDDDDDVEDDVLNIKMYITPCMKNVQNT